MTWPVHRHRVKAAAAHAAALGGSNRGLHVYEPPSTALVLGSSQSDAMVDYAECERRGIDVVRRRSGGGAVLLTPGEFVWIDFWLPRGDPLWDDDVGSAMWWVGDLWCELLAQLGVAATTHRLPIKKPLIAELCFTGVGPGEVVDAGGRKLVGISARRGREGARFQTLVHCGPLRTDWVRLLGLGAAEAAELGRVARSVDADASRILALLAA